ncbi:hypothetical protein ACMFMG_011074 [Clarireedia jacksonii]
MLSKLVTSVNDSFQIDDPQTPGQQLRREMVTTRGRAAAMEEEVRNSPIGSRTGTPKAGGMNGVDDATPLARKGRNLNGGGSERRSTRSSGAVGDFEVQITPMMKGKNVPEKEKGEDEEKEAEKADGDQQEVLGDTQIVEAEEVVKVVEKEGETPQKSVKRSVNTTTPIVSKHKRFGSEEPVTEVEKKIEVTVEETAEAVNGEEDESSDDDAPEEVNTNDAVKVAKQKAREVAKAAEEQAALIKKKRQEKDAVLKRQAVASKKRKLETDPLETMLPPAQKAKVDSNPSEQAPETETETEPADDVEIESNTLDGDGTADGRLDYDSENDIEEIRRTFAPPLSRRPLPDLLPEELLEDDDEDMSDQGVLVNGEKKPKFTKKKDILGALGEKKIKDKRVGNTTFRVVEKGSQYLAPKVSLHAKVLKDAWLQGRGKGGVVGANRKVFNKSFLGGRK